MDLLEVARREPDPARIVGSSIIHYLLD